MNYPNWYTDSADVYRVQDEKNNNLTSSVRALVISDVPCRIYSTGGGSFSPKRQAAESSQSIKVACDNKWDIHPGDELVVKRGFLIGHSEHKVRVFVGDPKYYFEPFGAVMPGLAHQELPVQSMERL